MIYFKKTVLFIGLLTTSLCCKRADSMQENTNIAMFTIEKDSCDDPDASIECCFVNMPKQVTSTMIIPDEKKDGEKMVISGTVYKKGKTPYPNVILYAYHTDSKGIYSKKGDEKGFQKWHGSHHGWCKTDKNGNYKIETIRPASYPKTNNPAHIHSAIKIPDNGQTFYINDFLFKDDPLLTEKYLSRARERGGSGVIEVKKVNNIWVGKRDIILD